MGFYFILFFKNLEGGGGCGFYFFSFSYFCFHSWKVEGSASFIFSLFIIFIIIWNYLVTLVYFWRGEGGVGFIFSLLPTFFFTLERWRVAWVLFFHFMFIYLLFGIFLLLLFTFEGGHRFFSFLVIFKNSWKKKGVCGFYFFIFCYFFIMCKLFVTFV